MKIAKVYPKTRWYAKCPYCRQQCHVRDDAPPFHAETVQCPKCTYMFEADLEERIEEKKRAESLAKKRQRSSEW